ncbi:hypothetical protein [Kosmotoga pacifica]|uniref:Uncharacterized protein n=1 Tax=Kosmotoga pacifica TaxID=1330330 RepID=A0A0G2ZD31_9BACT|nr:hypothetical protein [Kosmotoga pacifica]AKI97971.1 hypothetical protein IX53_09215 [Kosmotoga pacifica]
MRLTVFIILILLSCVLLAKTGLNLEESLEVITSVELKNLPETSILEVIYELGKDQIRNIYAIYPDPNGNWQIITEDTSLTLDGSNLSLLASETLSAPVKGKPEVSINDALSLIFLSEGYEPQAIFLEEMEDGLIWQVIVNDNIVSVDSITPAILRKEKREAKLKEIQEKLATRTKKHPEKPKEPPSKKPEQPPKGKGGKNKK